MLTTVNCVVRSTRRPSSFRAAAMAIAAQPNAAQPNAAQPKRRAGHADAAAAPSVDRSAI